MKEAFIILLVVLVLAALTAVKYRKQIAGMIGFARILKEAKQNIAQGSNNLRGTAEKSVPLVNCTKCGVWVPQNKARKVGDLYLCSEHRAETRV
ncbi:MAG: hypothetical protein IPL32_15270 [Chloracidobacterium sp.]|nr:hypothetical protein [Chloracidobacterium sp.]